MGKLRSRIAAGSCFALAVASSAMSQTIPNPPDSSAPSSQADKDKHDKNDEGGSAIIVTGTMLRRTDKETASPLVVLSADDLARRGIDTITQATQMLASNNSGTLPNSFSAQGAFAAGASAPSLRGLTTDSTLILFDGLRSAYYPLADDGLRNFVDTNTIPIAIVDQVQVLQDGASSTYGADAVAGVINILIKKEIKGFQADVSDGISGHSDASRQRASATYGFGDLASRGFNFYVSAEYQHNAALPEKDRGFPYDTLDYTRLVGHDANGNIVHGMNGNPNSLAADGSFPGYLSSVPIAEVAPVGPDGTQLGPYQPIAGSCGPYKAHPDVDLADGIGTICEYNQIETEDIEPRLERLGATAHLTVDVGAHAQAYAMLTYYQNRSSFLVPPSSIRNATEDGLFNTFDITLPALLTAGPNAGKSNPNDPFAAAGEDALIYYRFGDLPTYDIQFDRTYRGAAGIQGWLRQRLDIFSRRDGYEIEPDDDAGRRYLHRRPALRYRRR